ncbi:MAG: hypothetical protein JWN70_4554 [Planctomycetaceae bacterium]|nr:hypothetical protein [Planctomycetaceae bacterium]
MGMSDSEFKADLRLIVDLEDEINRAHPAQRERQWVRDRIVGLEHLYRHLAEVWWPIVPGHGTPVEGECCGDD